MTGYEKYQELMADWAHTEFAPYIGRNRVREMPENERQFAEKLFFGFTEISDTVDALCLAETLISVAPPRSKKISRDQYLRYQISGYLQEVYILKERLISYVTRLQRAYKGTPKKAKFDTVVEPLCQTVSNSLKGLVDTRGGHVHGSRFSDEHLDMMSRLHFLSRFKGELAEDAKREYWFVRRLWSSRVKENNEKTAELLDIYFEVMYELVAQNGEVVNPAKQVRTKDVG